MALADKKDFYDSNFYKGLRREEFFYSADKILKITLNALPPVKRAVDAGCGAGVWLKCLKEIQDTARVKGIDGKWVEHKYLVIDDEDFIEADISKTFPDLGEKFDLAISLEVAEHLPPERAEDFVNWLTSLSDFVLFSAAIPLQGGTCHFNEQWQDWWAELFEKNGYVPFDIVRAQIWNDEKIPVYYRQNTILYVNRNEIHRVKAKHIPRENLMLSVVHPQCYKSVHTTKSIFWKGVLRNALKKSVKRIFMRLTGQGT